jgi:flagellar motor switch protein FliG
MALTGPQKAAALILGLEEATAAAILRELDPADLRRLVPIVDGLQVGALEELDAVFVEFADLMARPAIPGTGGSYLRKLASTALGAGALDRLLANPEAAVDPRDALRAARTSTLAELLGDEHPQVAAVILTQLEPAQAARVMLALTPEQQADLLARLATLEEIQVAALDAASEAVARILEQSGVSTEASSEFDGVAFAAGLLNEMTGPDADRLVAAVEADHAALAPRLRDAMFTFEDLARIDKRAMGMLMREVPGDELRLALRQASESLREMFLSAVSSRVAEELRDDLANMPPVRLSEIEKAQRAVVDAAVRLAGEGKLVLPKGGGEEKLV